MRRVLAGLIIATFAALAPSWTLADDARIAQSVVSKLKAFQDAGQLKGFDIQVKVEEGNVWMMGQVADQTQRNLVLDAARRVKGVRLVVNGLSVPSTGPAAPAAPAPTSPGAAKAATPNSTIQLTAASGPQPRLSAPQNLRQPRSLLSGFRKVMRNPFASPQKTAASQTTRRSAARAKGTVFQKPNLPTLAKTADKAAATPAREPTGTGVAASATDPSPALKTAAAQSITPTRTVAPPRTPATQFAGQPMALRPVQMVYQQQPVLPRGTPMGYPRQPIQQVAYPGMAMMAAPMAMAQMPGAGPAVAHYPSGGRAVAPARYDHPRMPGYAWPSYASHPNYAAVTYPKQYSPTAWPYIGPFYPYPQVPLGWRKVTLEWDDGWWMLDFKDK